MINENLPRQMQLSLASSQYGVGTGWIEWKLETGEFASIGDAVAFACDNMDAVAAEWRERRRALREIERANAPVPAWKTM
jgi:hypothetical protein